MPGNSRYSLNLPYLYVEKKRETIRDFLKSPLEEKHSSKDLMLSPAPLPSPVLRGVCWANINRSELRGCCGFKGLRGNVCVTSVVIIAVLRSREANSNSLCCEPLSPPCHAGQLIGPLILGPGVLQLPQPEFFLINDI